MQKQQIDKKDQLSFVDKEEETIYNILCGHIKYKSIPFTEDDLDPDLILKINIPNDPIIKKSEYLTLIHYAGKAMPKLEHAYSKIEDAIIKQMAKNKENTDANNINIRFAQRLMQIEEMIPKKKVIEHENDFIQEFKIGCWHKYGNISDTFMLRVHSIIYILQKQCGFRVRSFILGDSNDKRSIYLLLGQNTQNLIKQANKYKIKKEIDYTALDFYLNEPLDSDDRQLRYNNHFKSQDSFQFKIKEIERYFKIPSGNKVDQELIEEIEPSEEDEYYYRNFMDESYEIFSYIKKTQIRLTNDEKRYIFQVNRRKINKGCEKLFTNLKKRREFFLLNKQLLARNGYYVNDEPVTYQPFTLPDKSTEGMSFFSRLRSILFFKPMIVTSDGGLSLFLKMQRIKLGYLSLKTHFKIDYLQMIGCQIFALSNDFQKFGSRKSIIKGGINGRYLEKDWKSFVFFSDINTIRNYVGESMAFEILAISNMIIFLTIVSIPFAILFTLETIFKEINFYTSQIEIVLMVISFSCFMENWRITQEEFINNYSEEVKSAIFRNKFRGSYRRNILTDEVNQFQAEQGYLTLLKNLICIIIFLAVFAFFGGVFHGTRQFLLAIFENLKQYSVGHISLPHIIAYSLYFITASLIFVFVLSRLIDLLIRLKNPPTDELQKQLKRYFIFIYLIGIQLIALMFFFIFEPFSGNSCYANSCPDEIVFYIYTRYIIAFAVSIAELIKVIFFKYLKTRLLNLAHLVLEEKVSDRFQERLKNLLDRTIKQSKKKQYQQTLIQQSTNLDQFTLYCTLFPISPVISLGNMFIKYTYLRISTFYQIRRPINKSEYIQQFSLFLTIILYNGIIINSWINFFAYEFVETNQYRLIEMFTNTITYQSIFLLKFLGGLIYAIGLLVVSYLCKIFVRSMSNHTLYRRKDNKYKEYILKRSGAKKLIKEKEWMTPMKNIYRVFNPDKMDFEQSTQQEMETKSVSSQANKSEKNALNDSQKSMNGDNI